MSSDDEKKESQNAPDANIPPAVETVVKPDNSDIGGLEETDKSQDSTDTENQTPKVGDGNYKKAIDTILALATFALFVVAIWQGCLSRAAINEAKRATDVTISNIDSTRKKDSIKEIADKIKDRYTDSISRHKDSIVNDLTKQSVSFSQKNAEAAKEYADAQVYSMNKESDRFNKLATPFLQFKNPTIAFPEQDQQIQVQYDLQDLTNNPVKVISYRVFIGGGIEAGNIRDIFKDRQSPDMSNIYITKEASYGGVATSKEKMTATFYNALLNKKTHVFMYAQIRYRGVSTEKQRIYECCIKMTFMQDRMDDQTYREYIYNENYNEGETPPKQ